MGKSKGRDRVLQKAKNQDTLTGMLEVLGKSPHKQHKRAIPAMKELVNTLSALEIEKLKKQQESQEFAKKILSI